MHIKCPYALFHYREVKAGVPENAEHDRSDLHCSYNIPGVGSLSIVIVKMQPSLDTTRSLCSATLSTLRQRRRMQEFYMC